MKILLSRAFTVKSVDISDITDITYDEEKMLAFWSRMHAMMRCAVENAVRCVR